MALTIAALVLLDRISIDVITGVEVASTLLISVVRRVLVRVMRPYAKKAGFCTLLLISTIYCHPRVRLASMLVGGS